MKPARKSNIELLRIISMIMIIAHHYVYYGIQQNYQKEVANIIYPSGSLRYGTVCYEKAQDM